MLLLVADENFNNDILRGLSRHNPSLDIVRIQDVGLTHATDPEVFGMGGARESGFANPRSKTQSQNLPINVSLKERECQV